ncbi:MutS-related protein [Olivibacter domesticus]|uniref:MutS domain III n=2 Tax=Olivibacter domesticus TaxID=407022 RepID=A0A1H7MJS9_OLID1|nr:MutS domain III [Olivibacter domesticus]
MAKDLDILYANRIGDFSEKEAHFKKRGKLFSSLRLVLGIFIVAGTWMAMTYLSTFWLSIALISTASFLVIVIADAKANKQRLHFYRLKTINEQEKSSLRGEYSSLPSGSIYVDTNHPFSYDLDVFGANSLFQNMNRTCTFSGERFLVESLKCTNVNVAKILERQHAVSELTCLVDFRQHFMAIGLENREDSEDISQLTAWLESPKNTLNRPIIRFFSFLLPTVTLSILIFAIVGMISYVGLIVSVLINLVFIQLFNSPINRAHAIISRKHNLLKKYAQLLQHLNTQTFSNQRLITLLKNSENAHTEINRLSRIMSFFDQRLNDLVAVVLNGVFLSDIHCIVALYRWKKKHKKQMPEWLDSIFTFDELNSLANFAFNNPSYSYPKFSASIFIEAENLGHPLIKNHPCVSNNFGSLREEKVVILTGANMSGKSTFLRTIGVNLILAYCGAPVFATKFTCSNAVIYTSMRVTDSLDQDTSYFYAELKRLSQIMDNLRKGRKMLILLDEILKGTNSADKLHGSIGLIEEFLAHECLCVIATHDLALGALENSYPKDVSNYCFESRLESDKLSFDYKIIRGIAQNKNATFLMQKAGLIK